MSASRQEIQPLIDSLLEAIGLRMTRSGRVILHFSEGGTFQRTEVTFVIQPGVVPGGRRETDIPIGSYPGMPRNTEEP